MNALLLLAFLAQTPAPKSPGPDYAPPDPVSPLPIYSTRPEFGDESISLCARTFGLVNVLRFKADPRFDRCLSLTEGERIFAGLGRDGVGLACEHYLGHGVSVWAEAHTFLFWGTARVGLIYYPCEGGQLPITLDLGRRQVLLPSREECLETAAHVGALHLAFGPWYKP